MVQYGSLTHCVVSVCQIYVADPVYIYVECNLHVGHLVSAVAKECLHDYPRWAHLGPRVDVHVRMRCTWMRACMVRGDLHAGAGRADGRGDCRRGLLL